MNGWENFANWLQIGFNKPFWTNESKERYIITEKGIGYYNEMRAPDYDHILVHHFIDGTLTISNYPPLDTKFYVLDPTDEQGYTEEIYKSYAWQKRVYDRRAVEELEDLIIIRAENLGWLD